MNILQSTKTNPPAVYLSAVVIAVIAMCANECKAASRWRPPSFELVRSQNQVTVAEIVSIDAAGILTLTPIVELYGNGPEIDSVRVPTALAAELKTGRKYIIGSSRYRKSPMLRDVLEVDPEGPRAIEIVGVGTAVFADDPGLRALISGVRSDPAMPDAEVLELILDLSSSHDPTLSRLAWTELFLRPDLLPAGEQKTAKSCRSVLESGAFDSEIRDRVFQIALQLPNALRQEWLAEAGRIVLQGFSPNLDLSSFDPALTKTVLKVLEEDGEPSDAELIGPYLGSNNPGVVKSAIGTLDAIDPAAASDAARRALTQPDLHDSSRAALQNYLNSPARDSGER